MFNQRCGRQIPEDFGASCDTLGIKPAVRDAVGHFEKSLSYKRKTAAAGGACRRILIVSGPIRTKGS
jgi:hypothetical protein